jgi:hypothetical protein
MHPGLYLELVDGPVEPYLADRLPQLVAAPGVVTATWWANVVRDRADLPRRLPEFDHLVAYEVDASFAAPPPAPGIPGHHYTRTARPGQGRLTGRPTIGLSLVLISPRAPEQAQALRDWGDFVHLRHIAEVGVPGYSMVTPYERVGGGDPRFLHWYEMDTDDPEAAFRSMTPLVEQRLGGGPGTAAFDRWATCPELRIMYVNTFRRLGEQRP